MVRNASVPVDEKGWTPMGETHDGIDIHGHAVPAALVVEARDRGDAYGGISVEEGESTVFTFPGGKPLRPIPRGMLDVDQRMSWLERNGLAAQLVAPWLDLQGVDLDPAMGTKWVSFVNQAMADWCGQAGGRLFPLASLHLADATSAAEELKRASRDLGCVGAMIPTHHRYGSVAVDGWEPFWEMAEEEQLPIVLHPQVKGPTSAGGGESSLAFRSLWGRPMDTTILAADLLLNRLFERFPDVRVVLVHGGGYLPYQAGRLDGEVAIGHVTSGLVSGPPSSQIGRFYFDTTLMSKESIAMVVDSYGPDRIVVGSDFPFFAEVVDPCGELEAANLDVGCKARISRENALRLFPRLGL